MRRQIALAVVFVLVVFASVVPARQASPSVGDLLAKAGTYLTAYEKAFSVVVSEERYAQSVMSSIGRFSGRQQRVLRSDVLQTSIGQNDWVAFRDVFEVDGAPVRDRDTRLQKLFIEAPSQALEQSRRIVSESARYNLGSLQRNINVPTMALTYLRISNQPRSAFRIAGRENLDGVQTLILSFAERSKPTVIRSATADLPATGRFWIEPASGRVVKSEIVVDGRESKSKITVTYASVPKLTVWAPVSMKEDYTAREVIRAEATYSNFRQFAVLVGEAIK